MSSCTHCGSPMETTWKFCEQCGTPRADEPRLATTSPGIGPLVPLSSDPVEHTAQGHHALLAKAGRLPVHRLPRRWSLAGVTLLVSALIAAVVLGLLDHGQLDSTRATLHATSQHLARTVRQRNSLERQLSTTKAELSQAQSQLSAAENQIAGLQNSLSNANSQINLQAGQISVLKTCLNGVVVAINEAAAGDLQGADATLAGVGPSCQQASALINQ